MNQARRRPFLCTDVSIRFNGWVVYFKVVKEEAEVGAQAAEVKVVQADAQADLDVALPTLEKALKALDSLTKNDITEVKSFAKPPPAVQVVMEAVCILLEVWATGGEEKVSGFLICVIYALTSWVALGDLKDEGIMSVESRPRIIDPLSLNTILPIRCRVRRTGTRRKKSWRILVLWISSRTTIR